CRQARSRWVQPMRSTKLWIVFMAPDLLRLDGDSAPPPCVLHRPALTILDASDDSSRRPTRGRVNGVKRAFVRLLLFVSRYRMVGHTDERVGIFVGAPHTSNWDFLIGLMVMWHNGLPFRVLIKKEWTTGPLGPLIRALGG